MGYSITRRKYALRRCNFVARAEEVSQSSTRDKEKGWTYKPGSVPKRAITIHLFRRLPADSSDQPADHPNPAVRTGQAALRCLALLTARLAIAISVTEDAVGSYPTLSPLPRDIRPYRRFAFCCAICCIGMEGKPSMPKHPGITRRCALSSPDFPPR